MTTGRLNQFVDEKIYVRPSGDRKLTQEGRKHVEETIRLLNAQSLFDAPEMLIAAIRPYEHAEVHVSTYLERAAVEHVRCAFFVCCTVPVCILSCKCV
jgi:hypothetical protein